MNAFLGEDPWYRGQACVQESLDYPHGPVVDGYVAFVLVTYHEPLDKLPRQSVLYAHILRYFVAGDEYLERRSVPAAHVYIALFQLYGMRLAVKSESQSCRDIIRLPRLGIPKHVVQGLSVAPNPRASEIFGDPAVTCENCP
jgi:hypothetical protein